MQVSLPKQLETQGSEMNKFFKVGDAKEPSKGPFFLKHFYSGCGSELPLFANKTLCVILDTRTRTRMNIWVRCGHRSADSRWKKREKGNYG